LAEAFGTTNTSQIVDLGANAGNDLTPAYAIYEQSTLAKLALINFMDDNQTGTNNLQVTVQVPGGAPQSVQVKYASFFLWLVGWLIFLGICLLLPFRIETILRGLVR
jgi:Glycosyl hydrolase family 79 C-terminal beta domain